MDIIAAIALGIIQGLTEFLPISSTGHLILAEKLLYLSPDQFGLSFDVAVHIGTAFAVLGYFWQTWWRLLLNAFGKGERNAQAVDRRLLLALVVGTIPAAIFGAMFESSIEQAFRQPFVIAVALVFGSVLFYIAERIGTKRKDVDNITLADGFLIGCSQAVALIPGISRSGITISAGLLRGYDRAMAARFAFLLSTPIIFGAGLKKFADILITDTSTIDLGIFGVGMLSSLITGYITIVFFLRFMRTHSLQAFIIYRIVLAVVILALIAAGIL